MGGFLMTKEIQFDAGHRVPDHASKCRNPHGHRYRVEATIASSRLVESGSARGMVLDFGDVKTIMMEKVHDVLDHGFIYVKGDTAMEKMAMQNPDFKTIEFPYVPTAENIARWIFEQMVQPIKDSYNDRAYLQQVQVWETPTSHATYLGG
jgi:6-pyruvoyltetrahydropterin/6-carboxytetrahydropterin synthase